MEVVRTLRLGEGTAAVSADGGFVAITEEDGDTNSQPAPESELEASALNDAAEEDAPLGINPPLEQAVEMVSLKLLQLVLNPEGYEFQGIVVNDAEKTQTD